ncbi:hypothetical protein N7513_003226 [Penicillium frequentans]|nr:hypothetical protein N7513_003226 [Penicillium glabrum]
MAFHVGYQSKSQEEKELKQRVHHLLTPHLLTPHPLNLQGFKHRCTSVKAERTVRGSVPMTPTSHPAGSRNNFEWKPLPQVPKKDAPRSQTTVSKTPPTSPVLETPRRTTFVPRRQAPAPPSIIPYSEQYPDQVFGRGQGQDGLGGGQRWFQVLRSNGSLSNFKILRDKLRSIGEDMPDGPESASQLRAEPELGTRKPDSPMRDPVASTEFQSTLGIDHLPENSYRSWGGVYELEAIPPSPVNPLLDTKCLWCMRPSRNGVCTFELIMKSTSSLDDLFNLALTTRHFFNVYKRNELNITKKVVWNKCPPAWEFLEMGCPNTFQKGLHQKRESLPGYLSTVTNAFYMISQLQAFIFLTCDESAGDRNLKCICDTSSKAQALEHALWRICILCFLFGSGGGREKYVYEQAGWLKGMRQPGRQSLPPPPMLPREHRSILSWYARGNTGGLSSEQLNDMAQLWSHLGRFFRPMKGSTGVKSHSINELGDADIIEQWVSSILTMGPSRRIHPQETVESCLNRAGELRSIWESDRVCSPFLWNALALAHPRAPRPKG